MTSKSTTNIPLPSMPPSATISHGFPSLACGSILSSGKIYDHNCTAIFTNFPIKTYNNKYFNIQESKPPIISGTRNSHSEPLNNVCLPIKDPSQHSINILRPESANATNIPHIQDCIVVKLVKSVCSARDLG